MPQLFSPWERAHCTNLIVGRVGLRAGLGVLEKRKSLAPARN
jgi:hypothetical protein